MTWWCKQVNDAHYVHENSERCSLCSREHKFYWTIYLLNICKCDVICENPSHGGKFIFGVIGIMWNFELSSFHNNLLGSCVILVLLKAISKIKKSIRIMFTISFISHLHPVQHATGFHRTHHKCIILYWVECK